MKFGSIFFRQHTYLKLMVLLLGVILAAALRFQMFLVTFGLTFIYLLPGARMFVIWFRIVLRFLPFFISYLLFAMLVDVSYPVQISFICRMMYLLLLSVYVLKTSTLNQFLKDSGKWRHVRLCKPVFVLLMSTFQFIPVFTGENKAIAQQVKENGKRNISQYIDVLSTAFIRTWDKIPLIEARINYRMSLHYDSPRLLTFPNLMAYGLITAYTIIAAC